MHFNKNFSIPVRRPVYNKKTSLLKGVREVDQFFTLNVNGSIYGWHSSDVSLLDKASKLSDQGSRYQALLQHIKLLMSEDHTGDNRSLREIFDTLKPAYLQSPTEVTGWFEWLANNYGSNVTTTEIKKENENEEVTEVKEGSADAGGSSDNG